MEAKKMKILEEKYELHNGVKIPKVGLGTWMISNRDVVKAVKEAIELGYRHLDTAQAYENEEGIGRAIRESGVIREELFVTTKLAAEIKSYEEAAKAIDQSLNKLDLGYIDMMIIHSPKPWMKFSGDDHFFKGNKEAWRALEEAYNAGKIRAIGLSNFEKEDVDNILESCTVKPMVNQILVHISNTPKALIDYCQEKGILVEAYSPIAHGELMDNSEVKTIADKYGVTIPQLSVRYCLQLGLLPLPKTSNPRHMGNNADVDFEVSEEDMGILKNIKQIKDYGRASIFPVYSKERSKEVKGAEVGEIFPKGRRLPDEWFTGSAFLTPLVARDENNDYSIGSVTFEPGARTNWHTHPRGQVLIVTDGVGIYKEKGKPAEFIRKGSVMNCPNDIEHWHGATRAHEMTHIAITNYKGDRQVTWLKRVTDEEYGEIE